MIEGRLPEQQQEESQHGVQTWVLVVVVADDSSETETCESAKSEQNWADIFKEVVGKFISPSS